MNKTTKIIGIILSIIFIGILLVKVDTVGFPIEQVMAYPIPNTPTVTKLPTATPIIKPTPLGPLPPQYTGDAIFPSSNPPWGGFWVICCSCKYYSGGANTLIAGVRYNDWLYGQHQTIQVGLYGYTAVDNCPVYVPKVLSMNYQGINSMGCINWTDVQGSIESTPGHPYYMLTVWPATGVTFEYCRTTMSQILRDW
jgi:hypothetical protein